MEEWKRINNYPNYEISNYGNIRNSITKIKIIPYKRKGYLFIKVSNTIKRQEYRVHRLVGIYFIANPNNYPDINHKDENKENNHFSNLEWCTKQYNNTYGTRIDKAKQKLFIKVQKYSKDNIFIEEYNSIDEAGLLNNILPCNISNVLNGKQKTAKGFIWKYK